MPLPPNGTPWPPKQLAKITPHMMAWDAWFSGDPVRLASHYGFAAFVPPGTPAPRPSQFYGGVVGSIARFFWGQPVNGGQLHKSHVPIAADLCRAAADLLYAEAPEFVIAGKDDDGNKTTAAQDRLDELTDDTLHGVLGESAEIGAALGGSYLQVSWDKGVVPDKPFLTCVHADAAWPEFRYGRLVAVTFWTRVATEGNVVWRHLVRHELDSQGIGVILHGLYAGGETDLGRAMPLTDQPATAPLAEPGVLIDGNRISTLTPGLACVYVPNLRPQRRWRNDPIGAHLGRSVLDGIEGPMDELDEIHSSWMRDIRLGKARVFLARSLLEGRGPGQGSSFDMDQEIYAPLDMLENRASTGGSLPIEVAQFTIRFEAHAASAHAKMLDIVRSAGFSTQTFGLSDSGGREPAQTATEIQAKQERSYMTRDRQIRLTRPALSVILGKLLAVDKAVFGTAITPVAPSIEFPDGVQESQLTVAQTALALSGARAASTKTLVEMVHPEWPEDRIDEEVGLIQGEDAAAVPPPDAPFGVNATDQTGGNDPAGSQQQF